MPDLTGLGLGQTTSTGTVTLISPTVTITTTGQELTVDGVRMVFQMAPGTEAPAEMHFYFPDKRALWAHYLTEAIELFAGRSDVVFASHHWPTWGTENITEFLAVQRDLYAYLHDQTLRLLNQGYTGPEIAEMIELPPPLEQAWHTHGYYGSVSHDVKAVYQRYMGWYDGNPARLWQHRRRRGPTRYVEGNIEAARSSGLTTDGDQSQLATLFSVLQPGDPNFNIIEP